MPQIHPIRSALLLAFAATALIGEEERIRAVRVGVDGVPASDDIGVRYSSASGSFEQDAESLDAHFGAHLELLDTLGAPTGKRAWLVGLRFSHFEQQTDQDVRSIALPGGNADFIGPIKGTVNVFDLEFGIGFRPSHGWEAELMPFAGFGAITVEDRSAAHEEGSEHGNYWQIGARASLHYLFASGFEVGGEVGYVHGVGESTIPFADARAEYDVTFDGLTYGISAGIRF